MDIYQVKFGEKLNKCTIFVKILLIVYLPFELKGSRLKRIKFTGLMIK
jgi:hypothetical protein